MNNNYYFTQYSPIDNTGTSYSPFRSAFKNIRFALTTDATYPINESDMANLAGIAFKVYNDSSLWYGILAFNGIQDQIQEVYPGLVLNLPSKNAFIAYLSSQQPNQAPVIRI